MALDSIATFSERIAALELDDHRERFKTANWHTMADLAFEVRECNNEEKFEQKILIPGLGSVDHKHAGRLRRLFYEAFTLAAVDLKQRVGGSVADGPRRVTTAERRERFLKVERRLAPGIVIRGELEPSERLIDRCIHIWDANTVRYLPLECCTKRAMEIRGVDKDPMWASVPDPTTGLMRLKQVVEDTSSPISSQFELIHALMRRALALEMGDLLSFENHELLRNKYVAALMKTPFSGFARFTMEQMIEADIHLFRILADKTREGVRRVGVQDRPLDKVFAEALREDDFVQAMTPRLAPSAGFQRDPSLAQAISDAFGGSAAASSNHNPNPKKRPRSRANKDGKPKPTIEKPAPAAAQPKATGKGNGKTSGPRLPAGLFGMCPRSNATTGAKRLCFSFNLSTCKAASPGAECAKGAHLCMKPLADGSACSAPHGALACTAS